MRHPASVLLAVSLVAGTLLTVSIVAATAPAEARSPARSLGELALAWVRGDFRAPLVCEIDEIPRQALRRVVISAGPRDTHRPMSRLVFYDLEAPEGTRCLHETGAPEPNIVGALVLIFQGRTDRPDLADHDFGERLRREGGFEFEIASGALRMGEPGEALEKLKTVDFRQGTARLQAVRRGSDAFRRLAAFGTARKLSLRLDAPDGTDIELDLVQLERP